MKLKSAVLAAMVVVLTACGGGGSSNPEQPSLSGKLDVTYGSGGQVTFAASESMVDSAIDSAGNAFVTGANLVKLDRSGTRVAGYGGPLSPPERAPVPDGSGNLYAVWDRGVVKRGPTGQLYTSFGTGGRTLIAMPTVDSQKVSMLHRFADGNLRAVTVDPTVNFAAQRAETFIELTKVDPSGQIIEGFDPTGGQEGGAGFAYSTAGIASALDAQGNLAIAGRTLNGGYAVMKFDSRGKPISAFAQSGVWVAPSCGTSDSSDTAVAMTASGDVYLGVSCEGAPTIFKVDAQGNLVGGFGSAGRAAGFFPNGGSIGALLSSADGSLYVAGAVPVPACKQLGVAKLSTNGAPEAGFGTNGVTVLNVAADDQAKRLALDSSGMLYVGAMVPLECPVQDMPRSYVIFRLFR